MKTPSIQQNYPYFITRDSCANVKILKDLEQRGFIKVFDVMLENGRENKKFKDKIKPVFIVGTSLLGEMVLANKDCKYDDIRSIIGKQHIKDSIHLEAHIRNKFDYFVTEDHDFLDKRQELENKFLVRIVTPQELQKICLN
jgi:predicted nucleic acid-binding protein